MVVARATDKLKQVVRARTRHLVDTAVAPYVADLRREIASGRATFTHAGSDQNVSSGMPAASHMNLSGVVMPCTASLSIDES